MQKRVSLDGEWEYRALGPTSKPEGDWGKIRVPSNWYLQGLNYHGTLEYRTKFSLASKGLKFERAKGELFLRFEGVDYFAYVYFNGTFLGEHEGYFQPFEYNISDLIKDDNTDNELVVKVDSPEEDLSHWPHQKRLIKGIFSHHDCRPGAWDRVHGQDRNTGGIWNHVYLVHTGKLRIFSIRASPVMLSERAALVNSEVLIENHAEKRVGKLKLTISRFGHAHDEHVAEQNVQLEHGVNKFLFTHSIKDPALWWSWDHGEQTMYESEARIVDEHNAFSDEHSERFGIREIVILEDKTWLFNRRQIFPRGTNIIPTQWLSEYDEKMIARDIELLRNANVNIVRVHAHVNRPELYDALDRAGIMAWQDFALQWDYNDDDKFIANARGQIVDMVHLLFNHPSIVVWCCHNEPRFNRARLDQVLYRAVIEADSTRHIDKWSDFEEHEYYGWYYGDMHQYSACHKPFINEFGAQALPSVDSIKETLDEKHIWPPDWPSWAYHDFQIDQTFNIAKVQIGSSLDEFVENSQKYQADLIKFVVEHYRLEKGLGRSRPPGYTRDAKGIFQFMFVDCWPAFTWSVLDYWRRPKRGYEVLKLVYAPVMLAFVKTGDVWIVNDLYEEIKAKLHIWAEDSTGSWVHDVITKEIAIPPNSVMQGFEVDPIEPQLGPHILPKPGRYYYWAELIRDGMQISKNYMEFKTSVVLRAHLSTVGAEVDYDFLKRR